ncbi:MAG: 50S ribosomal protein L28 [Anaerolineae bacterium]|nr:50S ribosomal protein L28 [Anaerolineae bacterium]
MAKCQICGKGTAFGNNVSHSKRATKRAFRPNLQKTLILRDGKPKRIVVCTNCLKTVHSR